MTVSDLKVLVENLDEYIHIPGGIERLKKTILHLAVSGQLVPQVKIEGTGEDLFKQIQSKYNSKKQLPDITDEDIPFTVPESWHWVRLGNISDSNIGLTYSPSNVGLQGTAVLRSNNIKDGKMNYDELVYVTSDVPESKMTHTGDLLICARNGSRRLVGKNAIIDREGMCFGAFMALLRSEFNEFIKLFLDSPEFRRNLDGVQTTTINQITQGLLNNFVFPLPPMKEQERIVERVDEIFSLIDELEKKYKSEEAERTKLVKSSLRAMSHEGSKLALDNLTSIIKTKADTAELRKAILHLAVSGKLVPQDPREGTGEDLYKKIQSQSSDRKKRKAFPEITPEEIPFDIPASWKWVRLADISKNLGAGGDKPKDFTKEKTEQNTVPVIANGETNEGIIGFTRIARVTETSVTVSGRGTIGYSVVRNYPYTPIVRLLVITLPNNVLPHYIQFVFSSLFEGGLGTSIPQLTVPMIAPKPIPLPPLAEQVRIVQKTTELLTLVDELEKHLEY